ncbi:hypothetical protein GCM10012319_45050 [Comamonas sp. KCTC 72670]|nr:hypothetical protein GCM10012319_45050 [Comamonas sp. KCTC 72670]
MDEEVAAYRIRECGEDIDAMHGADNTSELSDTSTISDAFHAVARVSAPDRATVTPPSFKLRVTTLLAVQCTDERVHRDTALRGHGSALSFDGRPCVAMPRQSSARASPSGPSTHLREGGQPGMRMRSVPALPKAAPSTQKKCSTKPGTKKNQ